MKKNLLKKLIAGITAVSMMGTTVTAFAEERRVVETNYLEAVEEMQDELTDDYRSDYKNVYTKDWATKSSKNQMILGLNLEERISRYEAAQILYQLLSASALARGESFEYRYSTDIYNDVRGDKVLDTLHKWNIMVGYPDGSFRPNALMTRQEFAQCVMQALEEIPASEWLDFNIYSYTLPFIAPEQQWALKAIRYCGERKLIVGNGRTYDADVTIEEMAAIVDRFYNVKTTTKDTEENANKIVFRALVRGLTNEALEGTKAPTESGEKEYLKNYKKLERYYKDNKDDEYRKTIARVLEIFDGLEQWKTDWYRKSVMTLFVGPSVYSEEYPDDKDFTWTDSTPLPEQPGDDGKVETPDKDDDSTNVIINPGKDPSGSGSGGTSSIITDGNVNGGNGGSSSSQLPSHNTGTDTSTKPPTVEVTIQPGTSDDQKPGSNHDTIGDSSSGSKPSGGSSSEIGDSLNNGSSSSEGNKPSSGSSSTIGGSDDNSSNDDRNDNNDDRDEDRSELTDNSGSKPADKEETPNTGSSSSSSSVIGGGKEDDSKTEGSASASDRNESNSDSNDDSDRVTTPSKEVSISAGSSDDHIGTASKDSSSTASATVDAGSRSSSSSDSDNSSSSSSVSDSSSSSDSSSHSEASDSSSSSSSDSSSSSSVSDSGSSDSSSSEI